MFSTSNHQLINNNKKEKPVTPPPLHIDTDPLGISFYDGTNDEQLKKGSAHAVVSPVLTSAKQPQQQHLVSTSSLSPFPSPSSSSSSVATSTSPLLHDLKSSQPSYFPTPSSRSGSISRSKCQINRRPSVHSPTTPKVSAKSWENIKSPAASFLASFALSPSTPCTSNESGGVIDEEQIGDEIDDYVLDKIIGYGGFSTVRQGFRVVDGQKVAIKIIKKGSAVTDGEPDYLLERELSIWKNLQHENIVCLQKVLETDTATFLICDYCAGGNLLNKLNKKSLSKDEARTIFGQLCQAVAYLHEEAKICHKDLKLENVLFDQDNKVKLCDFGLAICQQPTKINPATHLPLSPEIQSDLECAAGSLAYAAPEQIKSKKAISCPSTDIWSLGVILYALITDKLPFSDDYEPRLQQKILQGEYEMPCNVSSELQDLIKGCLDLDPSSRFTTNQILTSPWLNM